jgi:hypothetical protein
VAGPVIGTIQAPDAVGLIAFLCRDQLRAAVESEIAELADDEHALDPAARQERERAIEAQILETEHIEEAIIEAAEAEGTAIKRRDDADPRAVLHLASTLPKARS